MKARANYLSSNVPSVLFSKAKTAFPLIMNNTKKATKLALKNNASSHTARAPYGLSFGF